MMILIKSLYVLFYSYWWYGGGVLIDWEVEMIERGGGYSFGKLMKVLK